MVTGLAESRKVYRTVAIPLAASQATAASRSLAPPTCEQIGAVKMLALLPWKNLMLLMRPPEDWSWSVAEAATNGVSTCLPQPPSRG